MRENIYLAPAAEIIFVENADVITTSGSSGGGSNMGPWVEIDKN